MKIGTSRRNTSKHIVMAFQQVINDSRNSVVVFPAQGYSVDTSLYVWVFRRYAGLL